GRGSAWPAGGARGAAPARAGAAGVPVRAAGHGVGCRMLRKTRGQAFGGAWVFRGGRVEDGGGTGLEGARRAAVREAREETGLVLDPDRLVAFAHWTPPREAPRSEEHTSELQSR